MCENDDLLSANGFDSPKNSPTNARLSSPNHDDGQDMTREMMDEINAADENEPNVRINEWSSNSTKVNKIPYLLLLVSGKSIAKFNSSNKSDFTLDYFSSNHSFN